MKSLIISEQSQAPVIQTADLVTAFLSGRKATTLKTYRQDLIHFSKYLGFQGNDSGINQAAKLLTGKDQQNANYLILQYKNFLIENEEAANTINGRLRTIRAIVKLARLIGAANFTIEIENVKSQAYRDTRGPGLTGFKSMKQAAIDRNDVKGVRDFCIMRLLFDLGLRRGEVVSLDLSHVDLKSNTLSILRKGKTERIKVTLPAQTKQALSNWLQHRGECPGALFTNLDRAKKGDGRLTGTALYFIVRKYGKAVDLKTFPHGLRHAAITEALRLTNGNYQMTAKFSGHADPRTIKFYDDNREDLGGQVAAMLAVAA